MRVQEFDDKIHADKTFVWFTHNLFPKTLTGAGQKAEAYNKLLTLCRTAYNLNSGGALEANPAPAPAPVEESHAEEATGVVTGEAENVGDSGEGAEDSP